MSDAIDLDALERLVHAWRTASAGKDAKAKWDFVAAELFEGNVTTYEGNNWSPLMRLVALARRAADAERGRDEGIREAARLRAATLIAINERDSALSRLKALTDAAGPVIGELDKLWEQDCEQERTKYGREVYCSRCEEGVRGFHDDVAHWSDFTHKDDCIYSHGSALSRAVKEAGEI